MATNVLQWLETTAERLPDKLAVADDKEELSFRELRELAQTMGCWACAQVLPREAVAFYLEKSPRAFAGMLGVAYARGFYCVIDVRQPEARALAIFETLQARTVVSDEANITRARELFEPQGATVVSLDELAATTPDATALAARHTQAADVDPLYVTFTSGSTGTPKGVVTSHRSVLDFVPSFVAAVGIDETDVLGNQAPFDFDASVKDLYSSLLTGASVRLIPRDYFTKPTVLMDYLCDHEVTNLTWAVSAMCFVSVMNGFDYRVPTSVRRVNFSGEVMPPKQLAIWQRYLPEVKYHNLYGPTETTCNCTYFLVDRAYAPEEVIPMGKPFANEYVLLLDEEGHEVHEAGKPGEIYVGGTTLALGYLGKPELTAQAFVQNPLNARWMETLYRTGDLAYYNEAGDLVYISRKDNQIKHLGQRIELGEIESVAQGIDGVERAVCLYDDRRKRIHLVYLGSIERGELAELLKEKLPSYMVPNRTHQVDEMPLNKNGKTDRAALRAVCRIR